MKNGRLFLLFLFVILFVAAFLSCGAKDNSAFTCTLTAGEGATVTGATSVTAESGGTVTFFVGFEPNYVFDPEGLRPRNAVYDASTRTVTVTGITEDTEVTFNPVRVDYDTSAEVHITGDTDAASRPYGNTYHLGDYVTLTDANTDGDFFGWTFNGAETVVSTENPYSFTLSDEIVKTAGGQYYVKIQAKRQNVAVCYYDANGGVIHTDTDNAKGNEYMTVKKDGGRLKTTLSATYLEKCRTGTALWNDGTFTRDGYILKEYNTKADGSGDAYSPGSKVYQLSEDGTPFTLYCIWAPYDVSKFTTASVGINLGAHKNRKTVKTSGVIITGYSGNEKEVVVPDTIGGEPVIAIDSGVFDHVSAMETLILPRTLIEIRDGAICGCDALRTLYYPNGVYFVSDDMFEDGDYSSLETLVVYTSTAPVYSNSDGQGVFALKLSRVMATEDKDRLVIVGGSSVFRGLSTAYLEDLLDGAYTVVNFGTTRTTHCLMYVEALTHWLHDGDTIVYAPENSTYLMGDTTLYWKDLRDMEGMNNVFRYVDIGKYDGVFDAFSEYCRKIYNTAPKTFECIVSNKNINAYGDCVADTQKTYVKDFNNAFLITMNEYYRNSGEGDWNKSGGETDYTDTRYWSKFTDDVYKDEVNRVIGTVKSAGIPIYFGFCPVDQDAMLESSKNLQALAAYDAIFREQYDFDGVIGSSADYIFNHEYFDDNAFHTNNYGRTLRTYQLYLDLCETFGIEVKYTSPTAKGYVKKTVGGAEVYMYKDELCYFESTNGNITDKRKYTVGFLGK